MSAAGQAPASIRRILIVGGGTAGWMAAASLSHNLRALGVSVRVIESEAVPVVGVGEATVPPILDFIRQLGIDEDDLVREIKATFKLGISFRDWTRPGHEYFHAFGPTAPGLGPVSFPAYWLKMFLAGEAGRLEEYSLQAAAAAHGRFARPVHAPGTPLNKLAYAFHFDASLFAGYLRRFAQGLGVRRTESAVTRVRLAPESGFIQSVTLADGEEVEADLYIDCSGFSAILIGQALGAPFEDWTRWLPCDRAIVAQCATESAPAPFTLVTARPAGWQWRIPLQHRVGNGHVYAGAYMDDAEAADVLLQNLSGARVSQLAHIRFTPGRRTRAWSRNCVSLGLASGFLEPLEATGIHMIQRGLSMLMKFFPSRNFEPADIDRYNRTMDAEFGRVRDFLLLHYSQTERADAFWAACRRIPLTDTLAEKLELFRSHGRILREEADVFPIQSWLSVMIGQGVAPRDYDPLADCVDAEQIRAKLQSLHAGVQASVESLPRHGDFIATHCAAD